MVLIVRLTQILLFSCFAFTLLAQEDCDQLEINMEALISNSAIVDLDEAQELFDIHNKMGCPRKIKAYNFLGFVHYNNSIQDKAKEYFLAGEKVYLNNKSDHESYSTNQLYTALSYMIEDNYESSLYHLQKALEVSKLIDVPLLSSNIYQNLGLVNINIGELDQAEVYYTEALKYDNDSISFGYIFQNLAWLSLKKEELEEALGHVKSSESIWRAKGNDRGLYQLSLVESQILMAKGDYEGALESLNDGRAVYQYESRLLNGKNYLLEAKIYEKLDNPENQITALKQAILQGDDLNIAEINNAIKEFSKLKTDTSTIKVLSEVITNYKSRLQSSAKLNTSKEKLLTTELSEGESKIQQQLWFILLLLGLFLGLCFLLMNLYIQKSKNETLNQKLVASNSKIEKQNSQLKVKNKELEQFAYVASHDLKSPLRTISSFADLLKKRYGEEEPNKFIDIISKSAQDMSSLISELLNYSTLDQKLNIGKVNLNDMIQETQNRIAALITESNAKIVIDDSCNKMIHCDKTLFTNLIQNLISNSIRYCKEDQAPEIAISASVQPKHIEICFSDNGIGMDKAYQDKIFEMFTRLKTKDVDGTGIGLSTCKKIVESHKGTISVESAVGVGSKFIVKVPSAL